MLTEHLLFNSVIHLVSEWSSTPIPTRDIHNRVVGALVTDSILTSSTKSCLCLEEYLLVRSSEVTSVMVTSLKQHSHGYVSRQHSITHIHFLSGWLPFQRPPLHNWTVRRKVHTNKSNFIDRKCRLPFWWKRSETYSALQSKDTRRGFNYKTWLGIEIITEIRYKSPSTRGSNTRRTLCHFLPYRYKNKEILKKKK